MAKSLLGYLNPMNYFINKEEPVPEITSLGPDCPIIDEQILPVKEEIEKRSPNIFRYYIESEDPDVLLDILNHVESQHFQRPIVLDFCPGQRRMSYGQWWVPEGKTHQECTICEYCYNNKCMGETPMAPYFHQHFNISGNYKGDIPPQTKRCNCTCDCPKAKEHPKPVGLICPSCHYQSLDTLNAASCGTCKQCKNWVAYIGMQYCPSCSHLLKACHECGESLKEGNAYLEKITTYFEKTIQRYKEIDPRMKDSFEKRRDEAIALFTNKSYNEILAMAINEYQEKSN